MVAVMWVAAALAGLIHVLFFCMESLWWTKPAVYRRIEWWDRREGAMPNTDVKYPANDRAAAYLCVNSACSAPIFDVAELARVSKEFEKLTQR